MIKVEIVLEPDFYEVLKRESENQGYTNINSFLGYELKAFALALLVKENVQKNEQRN